MLINPSRFSKRDHKVTSGQQVRQFKSSRSPTLVVAGLISVLFAIGGVTAIRYSNAQTVDQVGQEILWQDAPSSEVGTVVLDEAQLPQWRASSQFAYGGGSVSVVQDAVKDRAVQFSVPARTQQTSAGSDQRAVQIPNVALQYGRTYWFGYDISVPASSNAPSLGYQSLWQLGRDTDVNLSKVWISLNTNREGLGLETGSGSIAIGPAPYDTWSRLVIGVNVTAGGESWIEVWRDGQNIMPQTTLPTSVFEGAQGSGSLFYKVGVHRSSEQSALTVKMANLKIGISRSAVQ